jgi:transposase-like protein
METISNGTPAGHDVQVSAKTRRRRFTAAYKLDIVRKADACSKTGEVGALLRREGLYSSHLADWRQARERGELLKAPRRGRKAKPVDERDKKITEQAREIAKLTARAERAEALVELQKKIAALLGRPFPSEES